MSLCRGGKPRIFMNSINRSNIDINVLMRGKEGGQNIFSERNISKKDHIDICVLVQGREGEEAYHGHQLQTNLTTGKNHRSVFIFCACLYYQCHIVDVGIFPKFFNVSA